MAGDFLRRPAEPEGPARHRPPRAGADRANSGQRRYVLVCGQGRMEVFRALGQTVLPAQVIDAPDDNAFMSLVETTAHHAPRILALLEATGNLKKRDHKVVTMASKTGLNQKWVGGMLDVLKTGEQLLVTDVKAGRVPLAAAIAIAATAKAGSNDIETQSVLQAYRA